MGSHGPAAAIWLTAAAAAQAAATVGSLASPLPVTRWVKGDGESVAWAIGQRPVLVQSVPAGRGVPQIDDLTWLQRRWRNGLAVVAIVQGNGAWLEALLARQPRAFHYPIAIDRTETPIVPQHWTGGPPVTMCLLIGSDRRVLWVGDAGEVDAVEAVLAAHDAGRFDLGAAARQAAGERQLRQRFEQGELDRLLQESGELLGKSPGNGLAWALRALAARRLDRDLSVAAAAPRTLASEPYELLRYARTMQRMLPGAPGGDATPLPEALAAACAARPHSPGLAQCWLRAAVAQGDAAAVAQAGAALAELHKSDGEALSALVHELLLLRQGLRPLDVVTMAVDLACHSSPRDLDAGMLRFRVQAELRRDREAALSAGRQWIELAAQQPERLNRFAWQLLHDYPDGRFTGLALEAAEAMARCADWETPSRIDTLELARERTQAPIRREEGR
jgi:hypothetical protein